MMLNSPQQGKVHTFFQSALEPEPYSPSCADVLAYLDKRVADFNAGHEEPSSDPIQPRYGVWRRAMKYECEDLNGAIDMYYWFCAPLEIAPKFGAGLRDGLLRYLRVEAAAAPEAEQAGFREFEAEFLAAMQRYPKVPMKAARSVVSTAHVLRCALTLDPSLPAPFPLWPLYLSKNMPQLKNRSEYQDDWHYRLDDDGSWARRTILADIEKFGWWQPSSEPIDAAAEKALSKAQDFQLSLSRIRRADAKDYYFDPLKWAWVEAKNISHIKKGNEFKYSLDYVVFSCSAWNQGENAEAQHVCDLAFQGELKLPERPEE